MSGIDNTSLAKRMKWYEDRYTNSICLPMIPVICRLDGKCFSKFTSKLKKPYDKRMSDLMIETTKYLVKETNPRCGYTQSDGATRSR